VSQETTGRSFDELARALASGTLSRGKALRLMAGLLVGGTLGSIPGVAWANDRCSQGQTRCGDRCVNLKTNERHCGSCRNRCGSKQTCCKGRCVNLQRNENHCGRCGKSCAQGQECVDGVCSGGCVSDGGSCTGDTQCCSGNCSNGTCCPTDRVGLDNGTCAKPCAGPADCPGCASGCFRVVSGTFCLSGPGSGTPCTSDSNCPRGDICNVVACVAAC
jgi:hypothetical protein